MTKIKPRLIARISCQECRRRKTRCNYDGQGDKCSTCARIGTPCIFAQKNGVVLDMDKVMEENNPHLVHQREKEQRAKERERERLRLQSSNPSESIYSKSSPSTSHLANYPSRDRSNSTSSLAPGASPIEDLTHVMDRLQIDAFGIAPHTLRSFSQVAGDNDSTEPSSGETSGTESAIPSYPDSSSMDISNKPLMSKRNSGGSSPGRSSRSRSVPLVDIQHDLLDLYFQHVHPYLLILHKPSFFRRLNDTKDPVPDFLLAAMYAVASHYAPGREADGRRYFEFWLSRLDDTLDKPRLSTIQALLLIIKYQEGVKHTGFYFRTYMYAQMVIVLARELQLHKTTPVNVKLDPESHEVRRRLFWVIFVLDQFISVSQGRTMSFREVEPEADLPRTDTEDPNDPQELENIENCVEYVKLSKINHQALILVRKFLTKVVTPEETIPQGLFLHQAMLAWKQNLPPRLQLASNMSAHTPFVAMLHILYHACCVMVQRCYCEDPSISHLEIAAISRETCTVSATNITVITDDLYTNYGKTPLTYPIRGCYFVIYCLIAAATIQANDIRRGSNGPIMFKRSLALLNLILRESTAVDIEKEVEFLKSSVDYPMDNRSDYSSSSSHYDHRPPLKPILPMSQKYGSRMNFSSTGVTPIRIRKISPKVSGSSSTGLTSPTSSTSSMGALFQSPPWNNAPPLPNIDETRNKSMNNSSHGDSGACETRGHINPVSAPRPSNQSGANGPPSSLPSSTHLNERVQSKLVQREHRQSIKNEEQQQLNEAERKFQTTPMTATHKSLYTTTTTTNTNSSMSQPTDTTSRVNISAATPPFTSSTTISSTSSIPITSAPISDMFSKSAPTFSPDTLPSDYSAMAHQQLLTSNGSQTLPPLVSLAQLLAFQQQQQQQKPNNVPVPGSSLEQLSAAEIQEQHRLNQQR
ncbi:hypothetical protein BGZ93_001665, partial [Podila epicladia]